MKPLKGIKVLDLSKVLAGPLCTQALADLGADVIKVEAPGLGDETRGWPPFAGPGLGAVYLSVNRNKRSVVVDLKKTEGREIVHKLAKDSDIAIESFGHGVAERLGVDAKSLQAINQRLIHCSISGFGDVGPMRKAAGYDVILQAFAGMMALSGEDGGGHIRSPISPIDQTTGTHALTGILAALLERGQSGKAATIKVSLFESAMGLMRYNIQNFWIRGVEPEKCGSGHESLCPYQAFEASDGPILIGVANDNLWRKFCSIAGLDEIVEDPRFRTNAARASNRTETVNLVQATVERRSVSFWDEELSKAGVPVAPINNLTKLLAHPHSEASGIILNYDHPVAGPTRTIGQPIIYNNQSREPGDAPPVHGQHTDEVLSGLGMDQNTIASLREAGVVA